VTAFGTAERTDVLLVASQEARELYLACPRWRWIERARLEREWMALVERLRANERERARAVSPFPRHPIVESVEDDGRR
jgi:hypothetical protein